jgi:hypothetical protein
MSKLKRFDQDLLNMFFNLVENDLEKKILRIISSDQNEEKIIDDLILELENFTDD